MTRFWRIAIALFSASSLLGGAGPHSARAHDDYEFHHENVMGTSLELLVRAVDEQAAHSAESRVLGEIDRLSSIFSGHDVSSEFCRWQSSGKRPTRISQELFEVLQESDRWNRLSGGGFDPRVEALTRLWASSARRDRWPGSGEIADAQAHMSRPAWSLGPGSQTAERWSDCPVSLDGIAKGYIVGRACDRALDPGRGVLGLMLNVGGDLRVRGSVEGTIGVAAPWADSESSEPLALIQLQDRSIATSGNSQRGFRINGQWYSHIIDPRSGRPVDRVVSATVIAPRSTDADALATAFNVLDPAESVRLADSLSDVECLIVTKEGRITRSQGWHRYERPQSAPIVLAADRKHPGLGVRGTTVPPVEEDAGRATSGSPWPKGFELVASFEINRPEAELGRYRRPYVAVWVEDQDGNSVRTLALWVSMGGAGPFQWLPDLKRWFTADKERKRLGKKDLFFTLARPTRPPGQYRVIWDGKDDQGNLLPAGTYTITIEAAREHGTYQSIRKLLTLANRPFTEKLQGNVEIRSASLEYRRKGTAK